MTARSLAALLALLVAAAALAGCSATCRDACEREAACNGKLGLPSAGVESCVAACEESTACENRGANLDCRAGLECETVLGYAGEELTCASKCSN